MIMKGRFKDKWWHEAAVPPDLVVNLLRITLNRSVTVDGPIKYVIVNVFFISWGIHF